MPLKPSGMQTSAGSVPEIAGVGRTGHDPGTGAAARPLFEASCANPKGAPMFTAAVTSAASNTPATGRQREGKVVRDYNPPMLTLSRRGFGRMVLAGVPLAGLPAAARRALPEVLFGVATSSFRDFLRVEGQGNL